jgi:4-hydroxy-tetrahydrodipicolinate reductase
MSAQAKTRVAVIGAQGRMGQLACACIEQTHDLELAARILRGDDLSTCLRESSSEIALDLTRAGLGASHGRVILESGVRAVIGTSGLQPSELQDLEAQAEEAQLGCLVVPNFCLGITIQQLCARLALKFLHPQGLDDVQVSLEEQHHPEKVDSPSSTSLRTAALLEADGAAAISIRSERLEGVLANQTVVLKWGAETLRLSHQVSSREAFGPGILLALNHVQTLSGFELGLESAFGARS